MRFHLTASLLLVVAIASAQDSTTTSIVSPAAAPAPVADSTKAVQAPVPPVVATTVSPAVIL
ncbi:MAG: hypothetical protein AAB214_06110 [Fibrobacterota bacterium]